MKHAFAARQFLSTSTVRHASLLRGGRLWVPFAFLVLILGSVPAFGQQLIATVPVGPGPANIAVNPVTNKIYVTNSSSNTVSVIDGATNMVTETVIVGDAPEPVALNPVTNKIYVGNAGANTMTVIDGATNATATVVTGTFPTAIAVNPLTNRIYVANSFSNNVTVIDGATNGTVTVAADNLPSAIAVNPVTNRIYVATNDNVTVIDGASNNTTAVNIGIFPGDIAVNSITNKIYVTDSVPDEAPKLAMYTSLLPVVLLKPAPSPKKTLWEPVCLVGGGTVTWSAAVHALQSPEFTRLYESLP